MTTTLITRANKGLGYETARRLIAEGHTVYAGAHPAALSRAFTARVHWITFEILYNMGTGERPCRRVEEYVVRYGKEHKQETRRRIIEVAGRRFKRDGIDGAGVATLMADAGLTNGAFYAHFASKDDLVATAVADQLQVQFQSLGPMAPGRAGVEQLVRQYLSPWHRDHPEDGCPSAALLDEISRSPDATRQAYTDGVLAVIDEIAARLAPGDPRSARVKTLSVYAGMAGTLQLARALADRQLSDAVLEQGIENALTLLGTEQSG